MLRCADLEAFQAATRLRQHAPVLLRLLRLRPLPDLHFVYHQLTFGILHDGVSIICVRVLVKDRVNGEDLTIFLFRRVGFIPNIGNGFILVACRYYCEGSSTQWGFRLDQQSIEEIRLKDLYHIKYLTLTIFHAIFELLVNIVVEIVEISVNLCVVLI
jgi:hypothetical protein